MKKSIIYIDQAPLSNISKNIKNEIYNDLSILLRDKVLQDKIICPESFFHLHESSAIENNPEFFQNIMENLLWNSSNNKFNPLFLIIENECHKICIPQIFESKEWKIAFNNNPHIEISKSLGYVNKDFRIGIEKKPRFLKNKEWVKDIIDAHQKGTNIDILELIRNSKIEEYKYINMRPIQYILNEKLVQEEYDIYNIFKSLQFENLPPIKILITLLNKAFESDRDISKDITDIQILSNTLPYSNYVIIDKYMKGLVSQSELNNIYKNKIFSCSERDLLKFIEILKLQ